MAAKSRAEVAQSKRWEGRLRAARGVAAHIGMICDPSRLAAILLLEGGECPAGAIVEALGKSPPSVSHHLALLRHGQIVTHRRQGRQIFYGLSETGRVLAEFARKLGARPRLLPDRRT